MVRGRTGVVAALLLLAAGACGGSGSDRATLELRPCTVQGVDARCGTFRVPENRADPSGRTIGLNVVVVPAQHPPAAKDAFTYIAGGPGGAATDATGWVAGTLGAVNWRHDLLLVDQRGTGGSKPLVCPAEKLETVAAARRYVSACIRSLDADVAQYGTRAAMDDLDDVRAALGYAQLDLYGGSYGATAAQVYAKRHPAATRTVTLLGSTELDTPFYGRFAENAEAALAQVDGRCRAEPQCRAAFPRWRAQLHELVRAWDAHPAKTAPGERTTGVGLAGVVQQMLVKTDNGGAIPRVVAHAAAGDYGPLNAYVDEQDEPINLMYWSIWCNEPWVGLDAKGPWGTDFDGLARQAIAGSRLKCSLVPKRTEPASEWTLPRTTAPTLVIAGGTDPQDPIANMPRLKTAFPNSRAVVIPHYGHEFPLEGCLPLLVSQLVELGDVARLDTSCVEALVPPFFTTP